MKRVRVSTRRRAKSRSCRSQLGATRWAATSASHHRINGDRRAVLGVQIDNAGDKAGARVLRVSPGGPAEEAGLRDGDVIVSLDGKSIAGSGNAGRALVEQMRSVKPEQKVKVRVLRDGKNKDFVVVARP